MLRIQEGLTLFFLTLALLLLSPFHAAAAKERVPVTKRGGEGAGKAHSHASQKGSTEAESVMPPSGKRIRVERITLQGNMAISTRELELFVTPWLGRELTIDELKEMVGRIQDLYKKKGYFLSSVYLPPQPVTDGVVRVEISEGKIGELEIEGNRFYSTKFIRRQLQPVLRHRVFRQDILMKTLMLLNEFMDLSVQSYFRPGKSVGTTDMVLKAADRRPLHVGVDYNNFGSPYTGDNRIGIDISLGNVTRIGDVLNVMGVFSTPSGSPPFISAAYTVPVNNRGTRMTLSYSSADMRIGQEMALLEIRGAANVYGLTFTHPLRRTIVDSSNLVYGFTSKSTKNYFYNTILTSNDEIREVFCGYNGQWISTTGKTFLSVVATRGLGKTLGGMQDDDPLASRRLADNTFTKLHLDLIWLQKIWSRCFLLVRGSGQISTDPLVTSEQFSLGGPDSVRGYTQSEFMGDNGFSSTVELRVPITSKSTKGKASAQLAVFVDHGAVYVKAPPEGQWAGKSLTGAGAGLRLNLSENSWARLDWGWPVYPELNAFGRSPMFYSQFAVRF